MSDELISQLRRQWQAQPYDSAQVLRRLHRQRWTPHLTLALELSGCVIALGVGMWFAWVAAHQTEHQLLFMVSAAILLITAPVLGVATVLARRPALAWHDETPASVLRIGKRRAESSLLAMRLGRWHIGVVAAFVVALWGLQWMGLIHAGEFLVLYSVVCLVVSVGGWMWMRWRTRVVMGEREACVALLKALESADDQRDQEN